MFYNVAKTQHLQSLLERREFAMRATEVVNRYKICPYIAIILNYLFFICYSQETNSNIKEGMLYLHKNGYLTEQR